MAALADGYTGEGVGGRMNQENDGSKDKKKIIKRCEEDRRQDDVSRMDSKKSTMAA